jgi:GNAT superfamily N-acetyltransferase
VNHVTGGLLGYARWILPSGHFDSNNGDTEWSEAQIPDVSDEEKKQFMDLAESAWWDARDDMNALEDRILVVMDRLLAENIYIRLDYLAVHPENQRKGVGTALVESGIRYAKSVGIPIFTMAFNASRGFYERLGFREVERIVQDDSRYGGAGKYGAYFMVYDV